MQVITRQQAKEQGFKKYFTGKPCKRGHVAERFTSGGRCFECAKKVLPQENRKCKHCSNYILSRQATIFCSHDCSTLYARVNSTTKMNCVTCGVMLRHKKRGSYSRFYCGEDCKLIDQVKKLDEAAEARRIKNPPFSKVTPCAICLKFSKGYKKLCGGADCKKKYSFMTSRKHLRAGDKGYNCGVCGVLFCRIGQGKGYCSTVCAEKQAKALLKETRRLRKNVDRAKYYGVEYDKNVKPTKVFERDGWVCYLCGDDTPKELQGLQLGNSPVIEHVVPMSRGGGHTWGNVRCACHTCNTFKQDKLLGEFLGEYLPQKVGYFSRLGLL